MGGAALTIQNVGPIKDATIEFGDLTVLVGAQATGKSIALQLLNLAIDAERIANEMILYGVDWRPHAMSFWSLYFGEGMGSIYDRERGSQVKWAALIDTQKKAVKAPSRKASVEPQPSLRDEKLFYIPAQRVLTLHNGWPRPFSDYAVHDPYVVKAFSERIRVLLDQGFASSKAEALFPQTGRLKGTLRDALRDTIFRDFELAISTATPQRRLVLRRNGTELPFMVWSAGQREFVPLLVGLYWLLPPTKTTRRGQVEWVVIEEPENGLHPRAIEAVMLVILELLHRGYRVCVSTHSAHVLDVVWAIQRIRETSGNVRHLLTAFNVPETEKMRRVASSAFQKTFRTHVFTQEGYVENISRLDPGSAATEEAGWGGLSEFSGRMADAVAEAVAQSEAA